MSASDQTLDSCATSAILNSRVFDQMVLYSGRLVPYHGVSTWMWCGDEKCDSPFSYTNWASDDGSDGSCMGGYSDSLTGENGWVKRDCQETLVRVLCRVDCGDLGPDLTTDQILTTGGQITGWFSKFK